MADAGLLGVLELVPGLPDAMVGLAIGTIASKLVVARIERRGGELPSRRIRRIEAAWIGTCVTGALLARAIVAALA